MRLADGSRSPLLGHVLLPITVAGLTFDIRVAIMPHLDADCYLGVNFVRAFWAVLDPDTDRLFCKDADEARPITAFTARIGTFPIPAHAIRPNQCAGYLPAAY